MKKRERVTELLIDIFDRINIQTPSKRFTKYLYHIEKFD